MTPTLVRTSALDGAHTLDKPADHRKQQIKAAGRQQDLPHDPRLPAGVSAGGQPVAGAFAIRRAGVPRGGISHTMTAPRRPRRGMLGTDAAPTMSLTNACRSISGWRPTWCPQCARAGLDQPEKPLTRRAALSRRSHRCGAVRAEQPLE